MSLRCHCTILSLLHIDQSVFRCSITHPLKIHFLRGVLKCCLYQDGESCCYTHRCHIHESGNLHPLSFLCLMCFCCFMSLQGAMTPGLPIFSPMMPYGSGLTPQPVQTTNSLSILEEQQRQQQQAQQQQAQQASAGKMLQSLLYHSSEIDFKSSVWVP